jgi:hypothetical protein
MSKSSLRDEKVPWGPEPVKEKRNVDLRRPGSRGSGAILIYCRDLPALQETILSAGGNLTASIRRPLPAP